MTTTPTPTVDIPEGWNPAPTDETGREWCYRDPAPQAAPPSPPRPRRPRNDEDEPLVSYKSQSDFSIKAPKQRGGKSGIYWGGGTFTIIAIVIAVAFGTGTVKLGGSVSTGTGTSGSVYTGSGANDVLRDIVARDEHWMLSPDLRVRAENATRD